MAGLGGGGGGAAAAPGKERMPQGVQTKTSEAPMIHSVDSVLLQTSAVRLRLHHLFETDLVTFVLLLAVPYSMMLVVIETDYAAAGEPIPVWVHVSDYLVLFLYLLETVCRVYVERHRFHWNVLNIMDIVILVVDFISLVAGSTVGRSLLVVRCLRLLRLGRAVKVMMYFPELAHMVRGLFGALKALFWGAVLVLFALTVWSILATQFIHPLNEELTRQGVWDQAGCQRCPRAFETVQASMLTFTQHILAGDSWGALCVPIIEHYPATLIFFVLVLGTIQLAIVNLILATVLDKANESREQTDRELLSFKLNAQAKAKKRFVELCADIDKDGSGHLNFEEIVEGFDSHPEFETVMRCMDIEHKDLDLVFTLMDADGSGDVDYAEFADQLFKMRTNDLHTMVLFTRFYVTDIWKRVRAQAPRESPAETETKEPGLAIEPAGQCEQKCAAAPSPASAWGERVEKVLPWAEPRPPQALEELARLRSDLEESLRGISERLLLQSRMLEAMPFLVGRAPASSAPGSGQLGGPPPQAEAVPGEEAPAQLRPKGRRRAKEEASSTPICCRPPQEEVRVLR